MSNAAWIKREEAVLTAASHRAHDPKFGPVYSRGNGSLLWDVEGRDYIDFTCGYSASNFGHAFQPLVSAAARQLQTLTHLTQEPHALRAPLAEQLSKFCGFSPGEAKVHFNCGGSRAIETAWKAAFAFRRGKLISIAPSYHGRSLTTSVLSDTSVGIDGFVAPLFHSRRPETEYGYCAACPLGLEFPHCQVQCLDRLVAHIQAESNTLSAIIVEPALGARGYVFPPADYWLRLREVTRATGVTLIADEIQMGLGRAGAQLLSVSQGWQPDLVVLGKSLGGGIVPISAVVGRSDVMSALPVGSESETFACTPLAAAVALEVLNQLETGGWIEQGARIGERLRCELRRLGEKHAASLVVEGQGAAAVAEFICGTRDLAESQHLARRLAENCSRNRLLVHFSGPRQTRVVLLPPLTTTDAELELGITRLTGAFESLAESRSEKCATMD